MSSVSIYRQCSAAARRLLDDPSARTRGLWDPDDPEGIFTELDVIFLAARESGSRFSDEQMQVAMREAAQVMGGHFRSTRRAVRFGPIEVPGLDQLDYLRVASKIVYAPSDGVEYVDTPNGRFRRLFAEDDPIGRAGRRLGSDRNDLKPWDQQMILDRVSARPSNADQRTILSLRAELSAAYDLIDELNAEVERLRAHQTHSREEIRDEVERALRERAA